MIGPARPVRDAMKWLVLATATAAATAAAATDPRRLQWEDNCVYNCRNEAWPVARHTALWARP